MANKSVIILSAGLTALAAPPAAAQLSGSAASPQGPFTANPPVAPPPVPPLPFDPDQRVCLFDKPTHRTICHTYTEWQRIQIMRSVKENFEARTVK